MKSEAVQYFVDVYFKAPRGHHQSYDYDKIVINCLDNVGDYIGPFETTLNVSFSEVEEEDEYEQGRINLKVTSFFHTLHTLPLAEAFEQVLPEELFMQIRVEVLAYHGSEPVKDKLVIRNNTSKQKQKKIDLLSQKLLNNKHCQIINNLYGEPLPRLSQKNLERASMMRLFSLNISTDKEKREQSLVLLEKIYPRLLKIALQEKILSKQELILWNQKDFPQFYKAAVLWTSINHRKIEKQLHTLTGSKNKFVSQAARSCQENTYYQKTTHSTAVYLQYALQQESYNNHYTMWNKIRQLHLFENIVDSLENPDFVKKSQNITTNLLPSVNTKVSSFLGKEKREDIYVIVGDDIKIANLDNYTFDQTTNECYASTVGNIIIVQDSFASQMINDFSQNSISPLLTHEVVHTYQGYNRFDENPILCREINEAITETTSRFILDKSSNQSSEDLYYKSEVARLKALFKKFGKEDDLESFLIQAHQVSAIERITLLTECIFGKKSSTKDNKNLLFVIWPFQE